MISLSFDLSVKSSADSSSRWTFVKRPRVRERNSPTIGKRKRRKKEANGAAIFRKGRLQRLARRRTRKSKMMAIAMIDPPTIIKGVQSSLLGTWSSTWWSLGMDEMTKKKEEVA